MTWPGIDRWLSLVTRGLCLALLALVMAGLLRLTFFTGQPEPVIPSAEALAPVLISFTGTGSIASTDIVERPLFWPSRRPLESPVQEEEIIAVLEADFDGEFVPAEPGALDEATLLGVFATMGKSGVIINVKGERKRVAMNEEVGGWRLVSMSPTRAIFQGLMRGSDGPQEHVLELEHAQRPARPGQ